MQKYRRTYYAVLVLLLSIAYIRGLWIPLMHNDSAHHANIALHMHATGDYVSLIDRQTDYLDKPHFLFWSAALAFNLFSVSSFAYKITSLLFGILCIFSTYKLARIFYDSRVARLSTAILSSTYAFVLSFNDVRMDAILTGAITFSLWQLILLYDNPNFKHTVCSALGLAIGFSTKGAVGIVMPMMGVLIYLVQKNNLQKLILSKWVLMALLTLVLISPVLYCYYIQFDLHPEKIVRGNAGNSGLNFILFGQTLSRINGQPGMTFSEGDPLFYLHTLLWSFLPWTIFGVTAWIYVLIRGLKKGFSIYTNDVFFFFVISAMMLMLSIVSSKLPHYLTMVFSPISILTASYLLQIKNSSLKKLKVGQQILIILLFLVLVVICVYIFPVRQFFLGAYFVILLAVSVFFLIVRTKHDIEKIILMTSSAAVLIFTVLNFHFYPTVMDYQGGKMLAEKVVIDNIPIDKITYLDGYETANEFDFYLKKNITLTSIDEIINHPDRLYIISGKHGYDALKAHNLIIQVVEQTKNYHVSKLTAKFLNPATRKAVLDDLYLIQLN